MKKYIAKIFFILSLFYNTVCFGQIYFNFDYAVFRGENGNSILEIYYSVDQSLLKYIKTDKGFEGMAKISVIVNDGKKNLVSNVYKSPMLVADTSKSSLGKKLVGQLTYNVPEGNYKIKIRGSDFNDSTQHSDFEEDVNIVKINENELKVSDIEFSTLIESSNDTKSIFYKNTLEIIPNPSNLFGMNLNELHYYYELYGLTPDNISDEFNISYTVLDLNNTVVISQNEKGKRTGEAKAKFGKFIIDSLKKGTYTFRISITDPAKSVNLIEEKKFYIFSKSENSNFTASDNDFLKSEYAAMTEEEVEDEYDKSQYVRSEQESEKYEQLNSLDGKRKFQFAFWKLRDKDQNTPGNETKVNYFKRLAEANKVYKEPYKDGWKTDRGRIYILYGKPDDVERFPFEANRKSYEIWKYHSVEGGGECVFVEKQASTGVYWLVHSTFRNELSNDNWRIELSTK